MAEARPSSPVERAAGAALPRAASAALGVGLLLAGLAVLAVIVPHVDLVAMSRMSVDGRRISSLYLHPLPFDPVLNLPLRDFWPAYGLALLAAVLLWPTTRRLLYEQLRTWQGRLAGLGALGGLAVTLWPTPASGFNTRHTAPIVVYLLLGLLACVLVLGGLCRVVTALRAERSWPLRLAERLVLAARVVVRRTPAWFYVGVLAAALLALCAWNAAVLFERTPHIVDGAAQLFHARIFATGQLTAPAPPVPAAFGLTHIILNERWYSQYPPGHSAVQAVGVLLRAEWLVNPVLGALTVVAFYLAGRELYGELTGRVAALLAVLSPFVQYMSSEYMNHSTALLCVVLAVFLLARAMRRTSAGWAALAGLAGGWLVLTRPWTAVGVLAPLGLYALGWALADWRRRWRALAALAATGAAMVALLLAFNAATTGSPFTFGYVALHGDDHLPGFGHAAWGAPLTVQRGVQQTLNNLAALNKYLFEWPLPSLLLVAVLFAAGRPGRWDWVLLATAVGVTLAYTAFWYQDWCFGPRFLYETTAATVLLSARGLVALPGIVRRANPGLRPAAIRAGLGGLAVIVAACAAVGHVPQLRAHYRPFGDVRGDLMAAVRAARPEHAIVFCRSDFVAGLTANDPLLRGPIIFARDGPANAELARHFPDRRCYVQVEDRLEPVSYPR